MEAPNSASDSPAEINWSSVLWFSVNYATAWAGSLLEAAVRYGPGERPCPLSLKEWWQTPHTGVEGRFMKIQVCNLWDALRAPPHHLLRLRVSWVARAYGCMHTHGFHCYFSEICFKLSFTERSALVYVLCIVWVFPQPQGIRLLFFRVESSIFRN